MLMLTDEAPPVLARGMKRGNRGTLNQRSLKALNPGSLTRSIPATQPRQSLKLTPPELARYWPNLDSGELRR